MLLSTSNKRRNYDKQTKSIFKELGITIAERTHSELVQVIGKKFILYKPFKDNPVIILPKERKED